MRSCLAATSRTIQGGIKMSNIHRTPEEHTMLYAHDHCDGDQEEAEGHAIVKEVCKELREEPEE